MIDLTEEDKKFFGKTVNQINSKFDRCFWPKEQCSKNAIRAHSIQNGAVLDLLCDNDHVIIPKASLDINTGPKVVFDKVGRNKATTFTGLCDSHDGILFRPIDTQPFSHLNHEHLFLLSYRSVLRELHAQMKTAVDIQKQYEEGVKLGRFDPTKKDAAMDKTLVAISGSYSFYLFKFLFDQDYNKSDFTKLEHKIIFVENIPPTVAVSTAYSYQDNLRYQNDRNNPKVLTLNVFPQNGGLYVIFSFRKEHAGLLESFIEPIVQAERHYKLFLVSKTILKYCENIVLKPSIFGSFSEKKKEKIRKYFCENMFNVDAGADDPDLCLF
ncbi:MAG: hypothetical protein WDA26_01445 [Pusillimonas sp.]